MLPVPVLYNRNRNEFQGHEDYWQTNGSLWYSSAVRYGNSWNICFGVIHDTSKKHRHCLYIYVCMCVCVYVYMCVCMHTYICFIYSNQNKAQKIRIRMFINYLRLYMWGLGKLTPLVISLYFSSDQLKLGLCIPESQDDITFFVDRV